MRISTRAFYENATAAVGRLQRELGDLSVSMSSGKRVQVPSDDPLASILAARAHTELASTAARQRIINEGVRTTSTADGALSEVSRALRVAVDTTIAALQPGRTEEERRAAASEVRSSVQAILTAANTRTGDRYLFGGYQDRSAPFSEAGGVVSYLGDSGQLTVPVGDGRTCNTSLPGDRVLNYVNDSGNRAVDGVDADVFTVLDQLADALASNDLAAAGERMDDARKLNAHVIQLRGDLGASVVRMNATLNALGDAELRCGEVLAEEESMDIADGITRYAAMETNYQAMLSVLTRIMGMPGLFDLSR